LPCDKTIEKRHRYIFDGYNSYTFTLVARSLLGKEWYRFESFRYTHSYRLCLLVSQQIKKVWSKRRFFVQRFHYFV